MWPQPRNNRSDACNSQRPDDATGRRDRPGPGRVVHKRQRSDSRDPVAAPLRALPGVLIMTHRILVTSALPYVNGIKHLGNLAGSILPADVYARFQRLRGRDVLFICGTDEHGTPAELAALE